MFHLPELLRSVPDERRRPQIPTFDIVRGRFFMAVFRLPSLNVFEGQLKRPCFQRLLGYPVEPGEKALSADTVARVLDSLSLEQLRAAITLKKETDESLKDGLALMEGQPAARQWTSEDRKEHFEAWDVDDIETLETFQGKVRVVRVEVGSARTQKVHTGCAAVIGERARSLPVETIHALQRMRWHEENTLFNQWTQQWHLGHAFRHKPNAVVAVLLLWSLAFNLTQLFVYLRLRRPRDPRDPCDTIRAIVMELCELMCALRVPLPWQRQLESG